MIPLVQPLLDGNELKYLSECIRSGWISSKGDFVKQFEHSVADSCKVKYAVATSSGTAALHLALQVLGVGPGDEVIVPALTYIGSANAISYCGAKPVFTEIDPDTWNIDLTKIENKITDHTKAIIAVHLYGYPLDMDRLLEIANQYDIDVIEDACEAQGARYKGRNIGSIGKIGCFSYYANKLITTGEGGMLVTNYNELADKARSLCNHAAVDDTYCYNDIGFNYRMSNLQGAVGLAQMERFPKFITARQHIAQVYNDYLKAIPGITFHSEPEWCMSVCWLYSILVSNDFGLSRDQLRYHLQACGIESKPFFTPIPHLPPYQTGEIFPISERISKCGISLPTGVDLSEPQIEYIARCISNAPNKSHSS